MIGCPTAGWVRMPQTRSTWWEMMRYSLIREPSDGQTEDDMYLIANPLGIDGC